MSEELTELEKQFPPQTHKKMSFKFSRDELARLIALEQTVQVAKLTEQNAVQLINAIINKICLPRVGVQNGKEVGLAYDTISGDFFVYVPRKKKENEEQIGKRDSSKE